MYISNLRWWGFAIGVLAASAAVVPAFGQQGQKQDVLDALLVEVRGLRRAIEQSSSAGARVQLAMGRLQLQEQRINTMARRLEGVRDQKVNVEREIANMRAETARLDELAERLEDANDRKGFAIQSAELKRRVVQHTIDLQRLAGEEVEVASAIAVEQGRWTDINRALEELERTLSR